MMRSAALAARLEPCGPGASSSTRQGRGLALRDALLRRAPQGGGLKPEAVLGLCVRLRAQDREARALVVLIACLQLLGDRVHVPKTPLERIPAEHRGGA